MESTFTTASCHMDSVRAERWSCILLCAGAILLLISSRSSTNSLILIGIALMFIFGNQVFKVFDVTEVKERISHDHKLHSWSKQMTIKTAKATTSAGMQKDFDAAWDQISTLFPEFELNQVSIIDQKDTPKVIKAWKPEEISHKIHQKGKPTPLWSVKFPVKTKDPNLKYVMEVAGSGSILRMKTVLPLLETLKSSLDDLK
jgi:hypothetical protein